MAAKCTRKRIVIKKGRKVIADFMGHSGSGCAPRRKPKPPPKEFRDAMRDISRSCRKVEEPFTKAFGKCVRQGFRSRNLVSQRA